MSEDQTVPRYVTFTPDEVMEMRAAAAAPAAAGRKAETGLDRAVRYLTWAILSVCLALWAVVGFVFWIPLLIRSMFAFTFALSQGMLQGVPPHEAGRILREAVGFYRRGFTVAIDAVFGKPDKNNQPARVKLPPSRFLLEVAVSAVFWYLAFFVLGVVETSPLDLWSAAVDYPWADLWRSLVGGAGEAVKGVTGGGGEVSAG